MLQDQYKALLQVVLPEPEAQQDPVMEVRQPF